MTSDEKAAACAEAFKPLASVEPPTPHGWQPIETAPKDGTEVLAALTGGITTIFFYEGRWVLANDGGNDARWPIEPTHWMPLPEPPTS